MIIPADNPCGDFCTDGAWKSMVYIIHHIIVLSIKMMK